MESGLARAFGVVRQLCLFRRRSDPKGFVPDHTLAPVKESVFVPYIFTYEEVLSIVDAATQHEGHNMWGAMLRALTLVLYCTGMRLGEATRLHMVDVDLRQAVLTVQRSKGRARILAIRDDLAAGPRRVAVIGAGFIGAEVAATAAQATGCRIGRLGAPRIPVGYAARLEAVARIDPAAVVEAARALMAEPTTVAAA